MADTKIKKTFRKRRNSEDSDDGSNKDDAIETIEETKSIQKLRKRVHGVTPEQLAIGKTYKKEERVKGDPFKLHTGGYIDIKTLKRGIAEDDIPEEIGTSFAAETNRRDEDADMLKYVEEELQKRKGLKIAAEQDDSKADLNLANSEGALYELPDNIKALIPQKKKTEETLSTQMLSGIPEIDLGIEARIKNIEATEEAKQKVMDERRKKKENGLSEFVVTNVAVNFVQHNRYNIEDHSAAAARRRAAAAAATPKVEPLRVGDTERPQSVLRPKTNDRKAFEEKATDDFHFEKFRKNTRRY